MLPERLHDGRSGGVLRVRGAGHALSALAGEMEAPIFVAVEGAPQPHELSHALGSFPAEHRDCGWVGVPPGHSHGVSGVKVGAVVVAERRGDPALRPGRGPLSHPALVHDDDLHLAAGSGP